MDGAVAEVFERMLHRDCAAMPEPSAIEVAIAAQIELSGVIEAQCMLEFPLASARRLTDAFLGAEDAEWDDSMLADTVGELCNMIAGGWKKRLGTAAFGACISTPLLSRVSENTISGTRSTIMRRVYLFDHCQFAVCMTVF